MRNRVIWLCGRTQDSCVLNSKVKSQSSLKKTSKAWTLPAILLGCMTFSGLILSQTNMALADPDDCSLSGPGNSIATCSGNQSDGITSGIDFPTPQVTTLNINNLNQAIMPGVGIDGVRFIETNAITSVTINIDTGTHGINSQRHGIVARERNRGSLTINSTGNITAQGFGILARETGRGTLNITSTGAITTDLDAIYALEQGRGDLNITSIGVITTDLDAIHALEQDRGNLNIVSTGDLSSQRHGILARERNGGNLTIDSTGNITAQRFGIRARERGRGALNITSTGTITTTDRDAIDALEQGRGNLKITSTGNINSGREGIFGTEEGRGDLIISSTGDISSQNRGIFADEKGDGNIEVTNNGNIHTTDDGDSGIHTIEQGDGQTVITSTGNITAGGENSHGILVRTGANENVEINLGDGHIQGGSTNLLGDTGKAIYFEEGILGGNGGSNLVLNINGNVKLSSLSGIAIDSGDGNLTINNNGTLDTTTDGAIILRGFSAFNNNAGALFNAGPVVNLGGGLLTNDGTFSPGGADNVGTTLINGGFIQSASGTLLTTVDLTNIITADGTFISGNAILAGNVQVQVINPALGAQNHIILNALGGTTDAGLGLIANPILQASLIFQGTDDVLLTTNLDFNAPGLGLNPNQTNLANNLNQITGAGGGDVNPLLLALINGITDTPSYIDALNQLLPEIYLNTETSTLFAAEEFTNNLFSCPQSGNPNKEGQCIWIRPEGRYLDRDDTTNEIGFEEDTFGVSAGAQVALGNGWFVGAGIGYEQGDLDTDTGASSESDRFQIGGAIKHQSGPLLLAAAVTAGFGDYDTERRLNFGGFDRTARSSHDVDYISGQFRAAYLFGAGTTYFKPLVDLNITHIDRDGATETGAGAANLVINGESETYFSITPALEMGTEVNLTDGMKLQPFAKIGVSFYEDSDHALTARFAGAPAGVSGFTIGSEFDDVFADIEAGVKIFDADDNFSLTVGYEGRFSDDVEQHAGFLKGTYKLSK